MRTDKKSVAANTPNPPSELMTRTGFMDPGPAACPKLLGGIIRRLYAKIAVDFFRILHPNARIREIPCDENGDTAAKVRSDNMRGKSA